MPASTNPTSVSAASPAITAYTRLARSRPSRTTAVRFFTWSSLAASWKPLMKRMRATRIDTGTDAASATAGT